MVFEGLVAILCARLEQNHSDGSTSSDLCVIFHIVTFAFHWQFGAATHCSFVTIQSSKTDDAF